VKKGCSREKKHKTNSPALLRRLSHPLLLGEGGGEPPYSRQGEDDVPQRRLGAVAWLHSEKYRMRKGTTSSSPWKKKKGCWTLGNLQGCSCSFIRGSRWRKRGTDTLWGGKMECGLPSSMRLYSRSAKTIRRVRKKRRKTAQGGSKTNSCYKAPLPSRRFRKEMEKVSLCSSRRKETHQIAPAAEKGGGRPPCRRATRYGRRHPSNCLPRRIQQQHGEGVTRPRGKGGKNERVPKGCIHGEMLFQFDREKVASRIVSELERNLLVTAAPRKKKRKRGGREGGETGWQSSWKEVRSRREECMVFRPDRRIKKPLI